MQEEMSRILSNPPNEIMSKGLEELFSDRQEIQFSIFFEDKEFFIDLDSFSLESNSIKRLSFKVSSEVALKTLNAESYKLSSQNINLEIDCSKISSLNCFYYDSDNYILEVEVNDDWRQTYKKSRKWIYKAF